MALGKFDVPVLDAAVEAVDCALTGAVLSAPGALASMGGAVAHGTSCIVSAASELNQSVASISGGAENSFANLLQGFNLQGLSGVSMASASVAPSVNGDELAAGLGDFSVQLSQLSAAKSSGWALGDRMSA